MKRMIPILILVLIIIGGSLYCAAINRARDIVLTGTVTMDDVIASSEMGKK